MDFVSKVLPKIGVKYTVMANTKEDPVSIGANMSLLYDSKELAGAGLTARPWELQYFQIPYLTNLSIWMPRKV